MRSVNKLPLLCAFFVTVSVFSNSDAYALKTILNNATGGDCTLRNIGNWNAATSTCTLTGHLGEGIEIADNGITLDGANKILTGNRNELIGVKIHNREQVTVHRLQLHLFQSSIDIQGGKLNSIRKNVVTSSLQAFDGCGICVISSDNNEIVRNQVNDNALAGIIVRGGQRNQVSYNRVLRNGVASIRLIGTSMNMIASNMVVGPTNHHISGISVHDLSSANIITENTVRDHPGSGIYLGPDANDNIVRFNDVYRNGLGIAVDGQDNRIYCNDLNNHGPRFGLLFQRGSPNFVWMNNFYANDTAADRVFPRLNKFDMPPPLGGNHWQANPNCPDVNRDSFCDVPMVIPGNQDNLPWVNPIDWKKDRLICEPIEVISGQKARVKPGPRTK